jgi:uncharacterized protein YuzE
MSRFTPRAEYMEDIDILMVYVREGRVARTRTMGHWRNVDLDEEGNVVEAEFINAASLGVDLADVPERETVERLIREAGIVLPIPMPGR